MPAYGAPLVGGHPALDFLNTIHDWTAPDPRDHIAGWPDAVAFGRAAGLLSRGEAERLSAGAPGGEMPRLRALRATLERVSGALVTGAAPAPTDLAHLAREAAEAAGAAAWRKTGLRLERQIAVDRAGAAALRLRIAEGAAGLLSSPRMDLVGRCPSCGWFFLDTSKNRSRRWCSMAMCGNSAKAKAYYRRRRRGR
jgi:predicted RNA-binding Zn ribbon-like protein